MNEEREAQESEQDDDFSLNEAKTEAELRAIEAEKKYIKATYRFDQGDLDEALLLIRTALSLSPGNAKYHYNIAFLYWRKDLLEVAINHYKMFLRYAPADDKDIPLIKGRIKWLEGEIKKRRKLR